MCKSTKNQKPTKEHNIISKNNINVNLILISTSGVEKHIYYYCINVYIILYIIK
jgi:hypothetical protein